MKRTTRHCYIQNMKALGLVVSEKKIFICFSHCKSMGAICCRGNQSSMLLIKFGHDWPCCLRDIQV